MGQAMQKITSKVSGGDVTQMQKRQQEDVKKIVEDYINKHYDEFQEDLKTFDGFYHVVYEIVEKLSEESGAMQFKLPPIKQLKAEFQAAHPNQNKTLTPVEFRKIIERVVTFESFYFGQGAKDILLFVFGVPLASLLAKRIIPGPTRNIPDDIFIPMATTGTVVYLAKTNKL